MAMVLAVGGLGAAMNLADLQWAVTVQPIVRQQSGTEPEQKTKLFGKKQTGAAASSEECAADGGRTHGTGTVGSRRAACRTDRGV